MLTCLTNIIGVTTSTCECVLQGVDQDTRAKLTISNSGVYMDDVNGSIGLASIPLGGCKTYAQWALDSIAKAAKYVEADIKAALNTNYKPAGGKFVGTVGQVSYAMNLPVAKQFQVLRLSPVSESDGVMTLTGIRVALNEPGTYPFYIVRENRLNATMETIFSTQFTATTNGYNNVPAGDGFPSLPIAAPGALYNYYMVWNRDNTTVQPKDNAIFCNCPSQTGGVFDYFTVSGGEVDSLALVNTLADDKKTHGIVLDASISCESGSLICREYNSNDAIAIVIAWMMAFKANAILIQNILDSKEINRYTMMDREALYGKRNSFEKQYADRIPHIMDVIDVNSSDCFICRDTQMFKSTLLS